MELDELDELGELDELDELEALDALEAAVERLGACDLSLYSDTESVERIEKVRRRLEFIATAVAAEFDTWGAWAPSGAKTAAAWLAHEGQIPLGEARRQVRRGRALGHFPALRQAWSKGEVSAAHLDVVAALRRPATEAALARDEEMLVGQATRLQFREFVRVARYWDQHADPDGAEEDALERRARRDVYLVPSIEGMYLGQMTLDPISGAIVAGEHDRLERQLFEEDWAKAKEELGRDPRVDELARTPGQRRADA